MSSKAPIDIFEADRQEELFVGRPFGIDYTKTNILTSDYWKYAVGGIPQGCFLLAFYEGEDSVSEALLLRALGPTKLPTDNNIISSMIEYYKDDVEVASRAGSRKESKLDAFTKHEFSFSGLECRILGSFYKTHQSNQIHFGADIENFYSANNYKVYKATGDVLREIVNQKDETDRDSRLKEFQIGKVRYSSTIRFRGMNTDESNTNTGVPVNVSPKDFLGTRTALFGMTRTGKSNTVKKIIEATANISSQAPKTLDEDQDVQPPLSEDNLPTFPVGQIIFDINGEYANENLQDEGTAIYKLYEKDVIRYSCIKKNGFKELKVNFYKELETGFSLVKSEMEDETSDYVKSFMTIDFQQPAGHDYSAKTTYSRLVAAYRCCLNKAGFEPPKDCREIRFDGNKEINELAGVGDPKDGISLEDAEKWFDTCWEQDHDSLKGKEELRSMLVFLTRRTKSGASNPTVSGYIKLRKDELRNYHTSGGEKISFDKQIEGYLRSGKIVIVDLSEGEELVQKKFSSQICSTIFKSSIRRFTRRKNNNFIQFYFEEAHNLFPQAEDRDLSKIYNRLAKEGAKLHLGLLYATQEVSSLSKNILKNTQNWFIAHLNNEDELKELKKYYDFSDFTDSLIRFSSSNDKGFVRMKTYTNPFVVPVQIDRFAVKERK
ncbi:MAG: DUF87 domain-containing protein [Candidatus Saccharibacteria bacterium]|nr:DUF87 domain-containing protein [Candidatus Saccharibacteria bacterium]